MQVVALDLEGRPRWTHAFGKEGMARVRAVATDRRHGAVYVAGDFQASLSPLRVDGGGGYHAPFVLHANESDKELASDNRDIFLLKVSGTGTGLWSQTVAGAGDDTVGGATLSVTDSGAVLLGGNIQREAHMAHLTIQPHHRSSARVPFVSKISETGTVAWATAAGWKGEQIALDALCADGCGNAVVAGWFQGPVTIGGVSPGTNAGLRGKAAYVAKVGNLWTKCECTDGVVWHARVQPHLSRAQWAGWAAAAVAVCLLLLYRRGSRQDSFGHELRSLDRGRIAAMYGVRARTHTRLVGSPANTRLSDRVTCPWQAGKLSRKTSDELPQALSVRQQLASARMHSSPQSRACDRYSTLAISI